MVEGEKHQRRRWRPAVLTLGAFALGALWFCTPLVYGPHPDASGQMTSGFHNLIFDSHERLHYVIRLSELDDALRHGQWLVRWCPNLEGGYGYPFFNFYAPLGYYLPEAWVLLGFDLYHAWKINFFVLALLAAVGMWRYARLFCGELAATMAGLLYLFAPYHISNLYVRGNVAEFAAMTLYPFLLLAFHRLARRAEARPGARFAAAALLLAALVLTHNVTAYFGTLFLCAYLLALWIAAGREFPWVRVLLAGVAGVLISACFWLPAVAELKYTAGSNLAATFKETAEHAVYWRQFFGNAWGFGLSGKGPADGMSFGLGWAHCLAAVGAVAALVEWRRKRLPASWPGRAALGQLLGLLALLALMSVWAAPLWKLQTLAVIQFPWRLMLFACLLASALGGCAVDAAHRIKPGAGGAVFLLLLLLLGATSIDKIAVGGMWRQRAELYRPVNTRGQFVDTNNREFASIWAGERPQEAGRPVLSRRRVLHADGRFVTAIAPERVTRARFLYRAAGPERLRCETYYFPGWKVYCDGKRIEARPSAPHGLIEFDARPGAHQYEIRLGWSPARQAGMALCLAGLALAAGAVFWLRRDKLAAARSMSHRPDVTKGSDAEPSLK